MFLEWNRREGSQEKSVSTADENERWRLRPRFETEAPCGSLSTLLPSPQKLRCSSLLLLDSWSKFQEEWTSEQVRNQAAPVDHLWRSWKARNLALSRSLSIKRDSELESGHNEVIAELRSLSDELEEEDREWTIYHCKCFLDSEVSNPRNSPQRNEGQLNRKGNPRKL